MEPESTPTLPLDDMPDDAFFDAGEELRPTSNVSRVFFRADHVELAEALVSELGGEREVVYDEGHTWRYAERDGVWNRSDPSQESRLVQGFAGAQVGKNRLKLKAGDVSGAIRLAHDQVARPDFFAGAGGVAFADTFVRATDTGLEVKPHARDNRARARYPFKHEKSALPRRFLAFLHDLWRDDDDRADKECLLQEFGGACILGIAPRYQRSLIGTGGGQNGKSSLADVLIACMPPGTTTAIAPQDWGQEYRRAMLVGKHLNSVGELPEREIIASESFKAIVSGDPIVGRSIRESPVMFRPIAGHYFAANKLPGTSDQTEGFWRRFVVLTFNRSFKDDAARDPHIAEKVLEELPAIVSWMLDGAARLITAKDYTLPSSHAAALAEWRKNADQIALFVEAETRPLRLDEPIQWGAAAADLYARYRTWSESNGHRAMASNKFAGRMHDLGLAVSHTRAGNRYPVALLTAADRC
jgi:putative DNA primase/helicase